MMVSPCKSLAPGPEPMLSSRSLANKVACRVLPTAGTTSILGFFRAVVKAPSVAMQRSSKAALFDGLSSGLWLPGSFHQEGVLVVSWQGRRTADKEEVPCRVQVTVRTIRPGVLAELCRGHLRNFLYPGDT